MANETTRPLKVFLCHASGDKPAVRDLYKRLIAEGVDAWLDQEKLLPGQNWRVEIPRAVREADVVVICLSNKSITKEGYIQKEIKFALDSADEKPEGTIFLIPARLEECAVPEQLGHWQWVDLFEENGFVRLLRSLKLRADRVGATIKPLGYESEDQETDRRIEQLYTEGLAAFYTEDWDRAYQRFQAILRERPNHKNAAEKLAQAERQRNLAKLYAQAADAYRSENWQVAIQALEELLGKSGDYKDSVQLLADAKKRHQLKDLYAEAKRLYAAQKWQAVVKVFEQISIIEPTYPDPEELLASSQREAAELKRLDDLNTLYSQGIHKMDEGDWYEARSLLEQVHKAQTGFLDTERLLRKVENEIITIEELKKRDNKINTLYEQAHGLIRSKNWRMALDKMGEIQRSDDQFVDKDGIFEKAKTELEHEEEVVQRQNELAAMYAEAVRLLKEGKYQEALDKWHEVKAIDPKYPDRQWVQRTARKSLGSMASPITKKPGIAVLRPLWIGLGSIATIAVVISVLTFVRNNDGQPSSPATSALTSMSGGNNVFVPTLTKTPVKTNTPGPPTDTLVPLPTQLPGTLVLSIDTLEKTIPWLPLDATAVPVVNYVAFNTLRPPFNSTLVRQAFAHAIDRQVLVEMVRRYQAINPRTATTLTPPETLGRDLYGEVGIGFDPEKAKELFIEAGYSEPTEFPTITFLVNASDNIAPGARFNMASAIADMWQTHLGVTVQVQALNFDDFINRLQTDPPDVYWLGWVADSNDPDNFLREIFHSGSQNNYGKFSNTEFDQLVDRAAKSENPAERQELYIRAERLLCETEAAVIPIYHTISP